MATQDKDLTSEEALRLLTLAVWNANEDNDGDCPPEKNAYIPATRRPDLNDRMGRGGPRATSSDAGLLSRLRQTSASRSAASRSLPTWSGRKSVKMNPN